MNVVFILWLRQLKLYSRSRARMIGARGQPTLFLLALGFGLGPTFARAGRAIPSQGGKKRARINQSEPQNGRSRAEPERGDRTRQSEQWQIIQRQGDDQ
jgi:hypothetical protein